MIYSIYKDLHDGDFVTALGYEILIHTRTVGSLKVTSGKLVACDPIVHPTTEPFDIDLPVGEFPVQITIAELRDEARIAYASILFKKESARSWKLLTVPEEDTSMFSSDEHGYTTVSELGCFMDADTADCYLDYLDFYDENEKDDLKKNFSKLERRAKNKGVSFAALTHEHLQGGNILTFSSGFGQGFYHTYVGRDSDGELARIVTDFRVLDYRFPSFGF